MGYLVFCTHSDAGTSGGSGDREGRPMSRVVSGEDKVLPLLGLMEAGSVNVPTYD